MDAISIVIGLIGMIALVAIPGYALSLALFPKKESIDTIERLGISLVLGLTPQVILYFLDKNLGVPITTITSLGMVALASAVGIIAWQSRIKKSSTRRRRR